MRLSKFLFFITTLILTHLPSFAQMIEDPATWKYEVKKKSAAEYELIAHLALKDGWHIWSLHPGGDGFQIAPSFEFEKNPKVKMKGSPKEKGNPIVTTMEGIDGKVTYFSGNVDYVQEVTVTGKTKITGRHTYQVCNDRMCLPPKDKECVFDIN